MPLCVFSHEMTNGLSKLQFAIVFCDVALTSRRQREQNGRSHNFPHRYFLPFILVHGQNFLNLFQCVAVPKYRGFVPRPDDSISLIESVITALTALHRALKTLTAAQLGKIKLPAIYTNQTFITLCTTSPLLSLS